MMNPLRNYIENCYTCFLSDPIDKSTECLEILTKRLLRLEKEIKILKCDEHHWGRPTKLSFSPHKIYGVQCICSKCGDERVFDVDKWKDIQLDQALDEVERLGGEVER